MADAEKVTPSNETSGSEDATQPEERLDTKPNQSPVDGRWAVVVVIVIFVARTVLTSQIVAMSVLIGKWEGQLGFPASQLAWSYSIITCLRYCAGPIAGAVNRNLGCRPLVFIGGVLVHLLGLLTKDVVFAVGIYFDRWHGLANGFAFSGASVGVMVGPLLTTILVNIFTWRVAVRIFAGMVTHFFVAAMVIRPLSSWMDDNCQKTSDTQVARRCSVATVSRVVSIREETQFAPQPQVQKHDDMQQSACTQDQTATTLAFAGNFIIALFTPFAAFATFGVIFGFGAGTALALVPPVTKSVTSREELPTVFGLQAFFQGIGQVICVYVQGVIYDSTGSYSACFYLTGASLFAAGVCCFALQVLTKVFQRKKTNKEIFIVGKA
ncbi:monocarboxylate transporter 12-B-like [Diadema antillarum]|uniref:monocarboxylate transporter 12-B-like n=1 Tax=Diadema antillarum TaxID=105358 RepID=UPI003A84A18A